MRTLLNTCTLKMKTTTKHNITCAQSHWPTLTEWVPLAETCHTGETIKGRQTPCQVKHWPQLMRMFKKTVQCSSSMVTWAQAIQAAITVWKADHMFKLNMMKIGQCQADRYTEGESQREREWLGAGKNELSAGNLQHSTVQTGSQSIPAIQLQSLTTTTGKERKTIATGTHASNRLLQHVLFFL